MIFFVFTRGGRKSSQCPAHLTRRFIRTRRFRKVNPRDVQMRTMIEVLVDYLAAFERARQFDVSHGRLPFSEQR
jgi:hypothetical protein